LASEEPTVCLRVHVHGFNQTENCKQNSLYLLLNAKAVSWLRSSILRSKNGDCYLLVRVAVMNEFVPLKSRHVLGMKSLS
jgi:hypothetical protein